MKSRKNTSKRGGAGAYEQQDDGHLFLAASFGGNSIQTVDANYAGNAMPIFGVGNATPISGIDDTFVIKAFGGSKHKSRKSRKTKKTKKGRGAHEGGKKKCPKHCRRHTRRTRKGLKHRKN